MSEWAQEVVDYWFGLDPKRWWEKNDAFDAEVAERYRGLWDEQSKRAADDFLTSPEEALGAIILFDQFPRNMFRGTARSFDSDPLALAIARGAIERGFDAALPAERRGFLYMPFEHSEALADQDRSVALFTALGDPMMLDFAHQHRDVIARFGRFPHRNAILVREPTPAETAATDIPAF